MDYFSAWRSDPHSLRTKVTGMFPMEEKDPLPDVNTSAQQSMLERIRHKFCFSISTCIQPSRSLFWNLWTRIMAALTSCYNKAKTIVRNFLHKIIEVVHPIIRGLAMVVVFAMATYVTLIALKWAYEQLNRYFLERKRGQLYKDLSKDLETQRIQDEQCISPTQFVIPIQPEREYQGRTSESDQQEERRPLIDRLYLSSCPSPPLLVDLQPYIQRAQSELIRLGTSKVGQCWSTILQELRWAYHSYFHYS